MRGRIQRSQRRKEMKEEKELETVGGGNEGRGKGKAEGRERSEARDIGAQGCFSGVVICPLGPTTCASPQSPLAGTGAGVQAGKFFKRKPSSHDIV